MPAFESNSARDISSIFIRDYAKSHPDQIAIVENSKTVTYGHLDLLTTKVAGVLMQLGCARGDRLAIILPDSSEHIATFFAAADLGAVAVPLSPFLSSSEYLGYFQDCTPRVAVVHALALPVITEIANIFQTTLLVVGSQEAISEQYNWDACITPGNEVKTHIPARVSDDIFLLYTSGSTGPPKAIAHSYRSLEVTSESIARSALAIGHRDLLFSISKLHFAYGLGNSMSFPLYCGARVLLDAGSPNVRRAILLISQYRPTVFFGIPSFFEAVLREYKNGLEVDLSSLRVVLSAGERLTEKTATAFRSAFGVEVLDGLGATETLHHFLLVRPGLPVANSCGTPVPGCEIDLKDDLGRCVANGEVGIAWIKIGSSLVGHWKGEQVGEKTNGDWIKSSDRFWKDEDGRYYHVGRVDDVVKFRGLRVDLKEIESLLLQHDSIEETFLEKTGDGLDEELVAHVVVRNGKELTLLQVKSFLSVKIPRHMNVNRLLKHACFPRGLNGKVDRRALSLTSINRP